MMHKDVRVYAPAGDTHTILAVAEKNGVKIPHDCKEGDCGSCLILVEFTEGKGNKAKMAITLSEKEKAKLRELGRSPRRKLATRKSMISRRTIDLRASSSCVKKRWSFTSPAHPAVRELFTFVSCIATI
jgi:ferredoxin